MKRLLSVIAIIIYEICLYFVFFKNITLINDFAHVLVFIGFSFATSIPLFAAMYIIDKKMTMELVRMVRKPFLISFPITFLIFLLVGMYEGESILTSFTMSFVILTVLASFGFQFLLLLGVPLGSIADKIAKRGLVKAFHESIEHRDTKALQKVFTYESYSTYKDVIISIIEELSDTEILIWLAKHSGEKEITKIACIKAGGHDFDDDCKCSICGEIHHDFQTDPNYNPEEYEFKKGWDKNTYLGTCTCCRAIQVEYTYTKYKNCPGCGGSGEYDRSGAGAGDYWGGDFVICSSCNGKGLVSEPSTETAIHKQKQAP